MIWISRIVAALISVTVLAGPVHAQGWVLDCKMTDYRRAKLSGTAVNSNEDAQLNVKGLVPPSATHIVKIPNSLLNETASNGSAAFDGKFLTLTYVVNRPFFGDVTITYSHNSSSGLIQARLRTQRPDPALGGRSLEGIVGTCSRRIQ